MTRRDDLNDRELEAAYASRLVGDLRADTVEYGSLLRGAFATKRDVLLALSRRQSPEGSDDAETLTRLEQSAWYGIYETRTAAFREMESAGRLGLLWNSRTRDGLANYYDRHAFLAGLFATSPGGYRLLVYEAIPGDARYAYHAGQDLDAALVAAGVTALLDDPGLPAAVNAELAYLGELVQRYESLRDDAVGLIDQLLDDYPR